MREKARRWSVFDWLIPFEYMDVSLRTRLHERYVNLVGLMIKAPISFFRSLSSLRTSFSNIGMTNARVFPEPVTASTTTSLWRINNGIVEAWTGVIWVWPIEFKTSMLIKITINISRLMMKQPTSMGSMSLVMRTMILRKHWNST